jgi:hypothetical protein
MFSLKTSYPGGIRTRSSVSEVGRTFFSVFSIVADFRSFAGDKQKAPKSAAYDKTPATANQLFNRNKNMYAAAFVDMVRSFVN